MQLPRALRDPRLWLAVITLVLVLRFPLTFARHRPYLMDFNVYHTAAQRLLQGQGPLLYNTPTASELMYFKYGPVWAVAWLWLAWLSNHLGAVVWSLLTIAWCVLACWVSRRLCRRAGWRVPVFADALVILWLVRPIIAEFANGQVDLLWGLLVLLSLSAFVARRPWASAVALAAAISLKLPAALFLPYYALRRQWGALARVGICLLALNLGGAWLVAPSDPVRLLLDWAHLLQESGSTRAFEIGSQSLLALLARYLTADAYRLNVLALSMGHLLLVASLVQAALFGLLWVGRPEGLGEPRRTLIDGALLTVAMVLFAPTCWIATYSALVWPVMLIVALWTTAHPTLRRSLPLLATGAVAALASLLTGSHVWRWLGVRYLRGESYVYLVVMTLPWMGLALFLHLLLCRHRLSKNPP
ncbi:MAG: DUF2029 domain-containing protein [Candidatus Omnitrophica bacterium]|nr:DUF2029 domain-containing protein [Candidatus Omnitrophota bacterium]